MMLLWLVPTVGQAATTKLISSVADAILNSHFDLVSKLTCIVFIVRLHYGFANSFHTHNFLWAIDVWATIITCPRAHHDKQSHNL